jgi:hypothetical protein
MHVNQSGKKGLFGLKIGWDSARAFLVLALLEVLPPDFLNSSGDRNGYSQILLRIK